MQLADAARQRAVLGESEHRPWPLPDRAWFMGQSWRNLLFAHWPVPASALERAVPPELRPVDTYDGRAWIGVTPFLVSGLRLRFTPPAPVLSRFEEINVRTYVTVQGRPGIYFFSLDAHSRSAVEAARRLYRLPYFHAEIEITGEGGANGGIPGPFECRSDRVSPDGPPAAFHGRYRATGEPFTAEPDSLEHFLTERYCLYTLDDEQRIWRGEIHHPPWPLQPAEAELERNSMTDQIGVRVDGDPLCHLAARQDVILWRIESVGDLDR